jgi:hypothetical protein
MPGCCASGAQTSMKLLVFSLNQLFVGAAAMIASKLLAGGGLTATVTVAVSAPPLPSETV